MEPRIKVQCPACRDDWETEARTTIYLPKSFKNISNNKKNLPTFLYGLQCFINLVINDQDREWLREMKKRVEEDGSTPYDDKWIEDIKNEIRKAKD